MCDKTSGRCACERLALPSSPYGTVKDNERLGRVVCNPRHIAADGTVKQSCFGETDVRERGLSLFRLDYMSMKFVERQACAICDTLPSNRVEAVAVADAGRVRSLLDSTGKRALCVVDDPTEASEKVPANDAHAIAFAAAPLDSADLLMIRTELREMFYLAR